MKTAKWVISLPAELGIVTLWFDMPAAERSARSSMMTLVSLSLTTCARLKIDPGATATVSATARGNVKVSNRITTLSPGAMFETDVKENVMPEGRPATRGEQSRALLTK